MCVRQNDPGMRRCLVFPPLPFTEQDGLNWVQRNQMRQKVEYARICSFFKSDEEAPSGHEEEEEEEEDRRWLEGSRWFPLMVLRDTSVNGGKDYIGECALLAIGHGVWVIGGEFEDPMDEQMMMMMTGLTGVSPDRNEHSDHRPSIPNPRARLVHRPTRAPNLDHPEPLRRESHSGMFRGQRAFPQDVGTSRVRRR
jgi:hypothetical protein